MHIKDNEGQYIWGFNLMMKGNMIEFYSQEKEVADEWIESMKRNVVFLDLKDDYTIGKLLGRGNFARVHLCNRKGDDSKFYALKTMEKHSIKKSRRSIVSLNLI